MVCLYCGFGGLFGVLVWVVLGTLRWVFGVVDLCLLWFCFFVVVDYFDFTVCWFTVFGFDFVLCDFVGVCLLPVVVGFGLVGLF